MDKKDLGFSDVPIDYLKQERDVCEIILTEFHTYPNPEKVGLKLLQLLTPDIEKLGWPRSVYRVVSILSRLGKIVRVIEQLTPIEIDDYEEAVVFIKPDVNGLKNNIKALEEEIEKRKSSIPSTTSNDLNSNQSEILYEVTFNEHNREIKINGVLIRKPDFGRENEMVFDYIYKHPNQKIELKDIEKDKGIKIQKRLTDILRDLGFKGDLRRIFFAGVSKTSLRFVNPVTNGYAQKNKLPLLI